MGLLDAMNDPVMAGAMGLLSAAGPSRMPVSLGQALGAGYGEFQQAQNMQAKRKFMEMQMQQEQMQMQEMQRRQQQAQAIRDLASRSVLSPQQQAIGAGGPTQAAADMIPGLKPKFDTEGFLGGMMGIDPLQAMQMRESMKKKPIKAGLDDVFLDPETMKPVWQGPGKDAAQPAAVREYEYAKGQGFGGTFQEFVIQQKRAGASNNTIMPKIEVKTGESVAAQIGPMLKESREKAISGMRLVDSADRILNAAEKGNLFAGPGANLLLKGAQVADVFGIGGKGVKEKIENTRNVVRGMAEQAVAARSQLGGQAQISNSEQELLNRATSGDISELTAGEIVQIAQLNDRLGRQLYGMHTDQLGNLGDDPNLAGLRKFYQVPKIGAPRQRKAPQTSSGPSVGAEQGGYRFKGGDPANPSNWEKL